MVVVGSATTTVGLMNSPPGSAFASPPQAMVAPSALAPARKPSTFSYCGRLATGPISVSASVGSPCLIAFARATTLAISSSLMDSCTMSRDPAMQVWPVAAKTPATRPLAAASRSASANTTCGDLPPSSRVILLMLATAAWATLAPVGVDPVNATLSTPLWEASASPVERSHPVTTLSTPAGRPASVSTSANATVEAGECSDGLTTQVQPAASSGASLNVNSNSGLFHGVIAPTTPTGSRMV